MAERSDITLDFE